jgi:hypothetical protein
MHISQSNLAQKHQTSVVRRSSETVVGRLGDTISEVSSLIEHITSDGSLRRGYFEKERREQK